MREKEWHTEEREFPEVEGRLISKRAGREGFYPPSPIPDGKELQLLRIHDNT